MNKKKPKFYGVLKVVGFVFVGVAIFGVILSASGFGDFGSNNFMIGGFLASMGGFIGISSLMIGFTPEINKVSVKTTKYLQSDNKEDLKDIANTSADISKEAVTTVARALKDGFKDAKYCKHCGASIDNDSKFCKVCGKEQ